MELYEMLKASKGAEFSPCKKYRYMLWRVWDFDKPRVMFIGLNPSKADSRENDPTITRVIAISKHLGFGGVYMMNLFPFISTKPSDLEKDPSDHIKENDAYIDDVAKKVKEVIFAWGAFPVMGRDRIMIKKFPKAKALVINDDGTPQHPLYVLSTTIPVLYTPVK